MNDEKSFIHGITHFVTNEHFVEVKPCFVGGGRGGGIGLVLTVVAKRGPSFNNTVNQNEIVFLVGVM